MCQADENHKANGTNFDTDTSLSKETYILDGGGEGENDVRVRKWIWRGECALCPANRLDYGSAPGMKKRKPARRRGKGRGKGR